MKHLIVGPEGHGVTEYALGLANATDAEVIREDTFGDTPLDGPVHVTFTDHLFDDTAERLLARVTGPLSVSLHDIPQPEEGEARYARRAKVYNQLAHAADVVVVNSNHEASFFNTETTVIRLPIPVIDSPFNPEPGTVGVLGFIYPGKGHEDLIEALPDRRLRFLGAVSAGHEDWAAGLDAEITGWLSDDQLAQEMGRIAVPVCPHRHFSASGSLMTWLGAGRTVLVRDSDYAREIDQWLPGRITLVDGDWRGVVDKHVPEQLDPPRYGWAEVAQLWEETWRLAGLT
ncbi:glycosyltransferase family 1 protein [Corynebacterium lujinxingii]|uniref:Glycosyltransferase family 1 protein n=1 Tax=Corynebacterium lujinxingii TaxID=2763010 RepID=A0A7H0JXR4_9CORY|nr:glycosyltransferase family 1 protein [Corynebacterium lujinxingii]MBC3177722.1 glycosyltransferase family 1 protein [Corynebacterium lujinxingii]NNO10033.1 glycosyltransferase family 1 protein [Corynebacterium lujinxingii]QNP89830.1 glycosyltransferase family 1 protein [Corynebacterium lujinxingii]